MKIKVLVLPTTVRPRQTWLDSHIRLNERTFESISSNSNFSINSTQKCALISTVEKWHSHLEKLLHIYVSNVSAMSESVSIAKNIVEDNEERKI